MNVIFEISKKCLSNMLDRFTHEEGLNIRWKFN
jgi:hypothetical protein